LDGLGKIQLSLIEILETNVLVRHGTYPNSIAHITVIDVWKQVLFNINTFLNVEKPEW
jgi:hypothetical protein